MAHAANLVRATSRRTTLLAATAAGLGCLGAFVVLAATPADAKLTPAQKCGSAKLKAAATAADAKVKCNAKTNLGAEPDANCLQQAEDKLTRAFTKAEAPRACGTWTGDAASFESIADTFVAALVQALQPAEVATKATPAQKCAVAKLKAASKEAVAKTTCQTKNLPSPNAAVLALCYRPAEDKFDTAFANAEKPSACTTSDDNATIEAMVDDFVSAMMAGPPTPTPSVTPTPPDTPTLKPGQPTPTPVPPTFTPVPRFVDNGGTITDTQTGLMWEKKDYSSKDLTYPWAGTCSVGGALCQPGVAVASVCSAATGGAQGCAVCGASAGTCSASHTIWSWLITLNFAKFAGHNDWRIPTLGELVGAFFPVPVPFNNGCGSGCTVTTCSCTSAGDYWSADSDAATTAWGFDMSNMQVVGDHKTVPHYVRAVR